MTKTEFQAFISEGRAKIDITKPAKGGTTGADLLKDLYNKFGTSEFSARQARDILNKYGSDAVGHRNRLSRDDFLEQKGHSLRITQAGVDWINANGGATPSAKEEEPEKPELAKGVKDIALLREKKFKVPKVGNNSKYLDRMITILTHMEGFAAGTTKTTYLLGGDPGTGKTSFIRSLSTLTGIPLVIIEAPHITQEHLINIPFLVIDGHKERSGNLTIDDQKSQMKVVQAESNLVTQLKQKRKKTQDQIDREINKNKVLRDIYPEVAPFINEIKDSYNSILFLDEFYRTSSIKIRNVLRNILNGKIGNDKIPKGVYIIMATNINDEGVDDIPLNHDFHLMNYDVTSKDDFMSYMYGKYVEGSSSPSDGTEAPNSDEEVNQHPSDVSNVPGDNTSGVVMNPDVWNAFMDNLTEEDMGFNDQAADVRLSPRRLEQMMIYINASLPVSNAEQARNLFAFIKTNLSNYVDQTHSTVLVDKFNKIVKGLIEEMSPEVNAEAALSMPVAASDWRNQLQNQVEMKIKLGSSRQYVPVVSGEPGIGKTSQMVKMAEELNMGFIHVDVSNLTTEDVTGLPIADTSGDNITTKFSEPNLYISIMNEYNEQINDVRQPGRKYNIILMFDEMNRNTIAVFNSIRKVLLEKSFDDIKLPDDIMVVGAINPTGEGTQELTGHAKDVLDIIPSAGNFNGVMTYLAHRSDLMKISEKMGFDLSGGVTNLMSQLASEFQSNVDVDDKVIEDPNIRPFYWTDGASVFYVSGREMTEAVANAIMQDKARLMRMGYDKEKDFSPEDYEKFIDEILLTTGKSFMDTFNMVMLKQDLSGFSDMLGKKITGNKAYRKFFDGIRTKKSVNVINLVNILKSFNGDVTMLGKDNIGPYTKDFSPTEMNQDVATIVGDYIGSQTPENALNSCIALYDNLSSALGKLKVSNEYEYTLKKYIAGSIISIMGNDALDLMSVLDNDKIMSSINKLTQGK